MRLFTLQTQSYDPFESSEFHVGSLDDDEAPAVVEKHKFPLAYFPDNRWSRKGYLRTRWTLAGTPLDLVNIHLFHDASNLVSLEAVPSVYSRHRRRALAYVLDRLNNGDRLPYFVFGDFNFRLEGRGVVEQLSRGLSREAKEGESSNNSKLT